MPAFSLSPTRTKLGNPVTLEALREELDAFARHQLAQQLDAFKHELFRELADLSHIDVPNSWNELKDHSLQPAQPASSMGKPQSFAAGRVGNAMPGRSHGLSAMFSQGGTGEDVVYSQLPNWDADEDPSSLIVSRSRSREVHLPGHNAQRKPSKDRGYRRPSKDRGYLSYDGYEPGLLLRLVQSHRFDVCACLLTLVNALWIGVQTEYMASNWIDECPTGWEHIEYGFCIMFTSEMIIRIAALGGDFFCAGDWMWNWFDFSMSVIQLIDVGISLVGQDYKELREVRLFRVIRVVRIARVLHFVNELRSLIVSIATTISAMVWLLVLLAGVTYIFAVILTESATLRKAQTGRKGIEEEEAELLLYYGHLSSTMLVLFESISGGVHWGEALEALSAETSPFFSCLFAGYIAFMLFALMNVATAIFVESAMRVASEDRTRYMSNALWDVLSPDGDDDGEITREVFELNMYDPRMEGFLKCLELDADRAIEVDLFNLLDKDSSGSIDKQEVVSACMRLAGTAKAFEIARVEQVVLEQAEKTRQQLKQHSSKIDDVIFVLLSRFQRTSNSSPRSKNRPHGFTVANSMQVEEEKRRPVPIKLAGTECQWAKETVLQDARRRF